MRHYSRAELSRVYDHILGERLPGMPAQGIREQVTTPRYEIGSRLEMPAVDGRIFHYCKADIAQPLPKYGLACGDTLHFMNSAVAAVAGARHITVVIGSPAPVPPAAYDAGYAKDQFKGGSITIHTAPIQQVLSIIGNDEDDGTNVTLHLGEPLLADVPLPTFVEVHENPYKGTVPMTGAGWQSVVAVALMPILADNYFWGQTWGPCLCVAAVGGGMGAVVNQRAVYFQDDGSIGGCDDLNCMYQYAGYTLPDTWAGAAGADSIFFMLQLAP